MASLRSLEDTNFGTLGSSKNKHLVVYDATQGAFVVKSMDDVLINSSSRGDLPDDFVTQIESELDTSEMELGEVDAGFLRII